MEIVLRVGTLAEFMGKARNIAQAGDARSRVALPDSRLSLYFETQDDLDEAVASAWVHTHDAQAFAQFPTFARPEADPLFGVDRHTIERIDRSYGRQPPWVRREAEGGMDTLGTVGISTQEDVNLAVLLFGVRLAMEHLAFLVRFLKTGDPFVFRVTEDRKIFYAFPVGARNRLLGMYVQMRPEDDPLLHGLQRVMDTGGEVALLLPGTVEALDALATFPGGTIADLPVGEMLETRVAFESQGTLTKVASRGLTHQEIASLSPLPGSQVRAA